MPKTFWKRTRGQRVKITGLTVGNTCLSRLVGMISKIQEDEFKWKTVLSNTEIVMG